MDKNFKVILALMVGAYVGMTVYKRGVAAKTVKIKK